jgi:arsenical pump membrane protein
MQWLPRFALPSLLSIVATYLLLRWTQRAELVQPIESSVEVLKISRGGIAAALGILAAAAALMTVSALDQPLGLPTCMAGLATVTGVCVIVRSAPWRFFKEASWSVIPLVAGLFVLVEALDRSGVIHALGEILRREAADSARIAAAAAGALVAFASNLINNLPAGLIAGSAIQGAGIPVAGIPVAGIPDSVSSAVLIGVDLGPNLSVTGSLATILWLMALRRDGIPVNERNFLKLGCWVMPPALFAALAAARL